MNLVRLDWDSSFFGYEVASCTGFTDSAQDLATLNNSPFSLIYVGLIQTLTPAPANFYLADEKIVLEREIGSDQIFETDAAIQMVEQNTIQLTHLALQSGVYSRFKIDPNFKNNEFEKLYTIWIENALHQENHKRVLAFVEEDKITGFVSISEKLGVLNIGLIAVDEHARGKGIGNKLINWVCKYAQDNKFKKVSVVTQAANLEAMNFYHKNFFTVVSRTFMYHVWK
jgi:dTDP-4-amino-4,6-dideoxy-D-galactose acyltransferase